LFLVKNIANNSVIFTHNLGDFDGFFLFTGLINNLSIKRNAVQSIVDKENRFIQITLHVGSNGSKFI